MFLTAHTFIHTCTHTYTSYLHTIPTLHTAHLPTSVTQMRESSRGLAPQCGLSTHEPGVCFHGCLRVFFVMSGCIDEECDYAAVRVMTRIPAACLIL